MARSINKELRHQMRLKRDSLSSSEIKHKSQIIADRLEALLESNFKRADIFLCYYPTGSEVNLLTLYERLLALKKKLYFPVSDTSSHQLTFYEVEDLTRDFSQGAYNIMEPSSPKEPWQLINNSTICLTPGLVFDKSCNRIGYGGGYYDRFFVANSSLIKIAPAYDFQLLEKIEPEPFDLALDYIVTDTDLIKRI